MVSKGHAIEASIRRCFRSRGQNLLFKHYFAVGREGLRAGEKEERVRSIAISVSVCLSVCIRMSFRSHISPKPHLQTSRNFLRVLPEAAARSFSDDNVTFDVLPVSWMTSCFT